MQLGFAQDGAEIETGDEVYTSGSDGVLPRGLRVGVIAGEPGTYTVRPFAELNSLDVVSVLFFDAPALTRTDPATVAENGGALSSTPRPEPEEDRTAAIGSAPLPPVAVMSQPVSAMPPPPSVQAQAER